MDEQSRQHALRTLEELVLDAGEVVSYRRLAGELCLHVNRCKALLQEFVDSHENAHELKVSVLVCGATGGGARTLLCSRAELESVRASLQPVFFEHIYAVSRSSAALDAAVLATAAGGFDDFTSSVGAICSASCVKRSQEEIGSLMINSYKNITSDIVTASKSTKDSRTVKNSTPEVESKVQNGTTTPDVKLALPSENPKATVPEKMKEPISSKKETDSKSKGKPQNNISNFFSKSNGTQSGKKKLDIKVEPKEVRVKCEDKNEVKILSTVDEDKSEPNNSKKNRKTPEKPEVKKETSKEKKKTPEKLEVKKENSKEKKKPSEKLEVKKETSKEKKTPEPVVKKETSKKSAVVSVGKNSKVDKKRKRVLHISDSEDSDKEDPFEVEKVPEVTEDSDDDVIPPTPNAELVKVTSARLNPKKRRKIIDKTFTTDDGYMVTRKEEILESCSEEEVEMKENIVETNVKKETLPEKKIPAVTPKSKKKPASPQKGKQASIMNFFKKKP